ncbi:hypothetical protein ACTWPT_56270 [Nonomuraea sp. 3N208]|uniref:hypothetical protein n=1 Tax=Nonomuraea sp. 3N208 TaxID=3457421 RepID=UPI003FD4AFD6
MPLVAGQAREHLGAEVVDDVAVVAPDGLRTAYGIGRAAQGQGREVQPGGPALGTVDEPRDLVGVERDPAHIGHQADRLLRREREIGRTDLGELSTCAQACQRKRWVEARGDQDADRRRQVGQHELGRLVDPAVGDQVVVVEHEHDYALGVVGRQVVDEARHGDIERLETGNAQRSHRLRPDARAGALKRRDDVGPESHRVVVGLVQRDPCDLPPPCATGGPLGQQCRLAPAGRPDDHGHRRESVVEHAQQPPP